MTLFMSDTIRQLREKELCSLIHLENLFMADIEKRKEMLTHVKDMQIRIKADMGLVTDGAGV